MNIDFSAQSKWSKKGDLEPFKALREKMEGLGVLVFQMSRVPSEEGCGFALAETQRPVIAVNQRDVPNRRSFSLLHEFVHLMLGQSGVSDLEVNGSRKPDIQEVELFCSAVAAPAPGSSTRMFPSISVNRLAMNRPMGTGVMY